MNAPRTRVQRRPVHGVLLLDKPLGLSSNDALQKAKWLLRAEKAGHTGTLDPMATGVLPLCFGAATKFSQLQLEADKANEAVAVLGVRTTTGDEWFEHHAAFHSTILQAANRPRFIALANNLKDQSEPYVRLATKLDQSLRARSEQEHAELLAAMKAHDSETALKITAAHLQSTLESVYRIYTAARGLFVPLGP